MTEQQYRNLLSIYGRGATERMFPRCTQWLYAQWEKRQGARRADNAKNKDV